MRATPRQATDAPLRANVFVAFTLALIAACATSALVQGIFTLDRWYPVRVCGLLVLVFKVAADFVGAGHPFPRFGVANHVTTARAVIVALGVGLVGQHEVSPAALGVAVGLSGAALDGVDGWLARRTRMSSAFGARFDMEVDALLILTLSVLVWQYDKAGAWIVTAGLLRYAFVGGQRLFPPAQRELSPSRRRQVICVILVVGLSVILLPSVPSTISVWVAGGLVSMLAWSFAVDTIWLWRRHD